MQTRSQLDLRQRRRTAREAREARTTMTRALSSSGAENTREMNMPLESKYWCLENSLF